ncbi:MAG: DNA polymerase IV [Actinomycetota bacterium]
MSNRTILHVDMDAFYVSVELRRRPELRGRPVIVGGSGERGVVAAASYEARAYGIHSAMPSVRARRLCPHLVVLPGDHQLYGEVSGQVHACFAELTPTIEPIALDEAFLDVTAARRRLGDGTTIAHELRRRIRAELDLGASVGVATSKLLAKLASEAAKPSAGIDGPVPGPGVFEVLPGDEVAFLHPHPVQALWGVGPATLRKLSALGVATVGDLSEIPLDALVAAIGDAHGRHLHRLSHAIDPREVEADRATKSISHEETFAHDRHELETLLPDLAHMADAVAARLRRAGLAGRTVQIKVRFGDFRTITRSVTVADPIDDAAPLLRAARGLLEQVDPTPGVRLLGLGASGLGDASTRQLSLDDLLGGADGEAVGTAVDEIRQRFGAGAIGSATAAGRERRRVDDRPSWGPDA